MGAALAQAFVYNAIRATSDNIGMPTDIGAEYIFLLQFKVKWVARDKIMPLVISVARRISGVSMQPHMLGVNMFTKTMPPLEEVFNDTSNICDEVGIEMRFKAETYSSERSCLRCWLGRWFRQPPLRRSNLQPLYG
jgi:hypothetical protein